MAGLSLASSISANSSNRDSEDIFSPLGKKSAVWKFFGFRRKDGATDKSHALCKKCQSEIKAHIAG